MDAFSKPKPKTKKVPSFDSSDSEGEAKPPVTKAKPVLKRKQVVSDDSESSSDNLMSRLKAKTTAGSKVSSCTEYDFRKVFKGFVHHAASYFTHLHIVNHY